MRLQGNLKKMVVTHQSPVKYELVAGENRLPLNDCIGRTLRLRFTGVIHCIACGRETPKSFHQGYCYPCMRTLARCDTCIIKPEQCHYAAGTCREPDWAQDNCLQPHIVYVANTSGPKVGITRHSQVPTRWIDQGAVEALPILEVEQRLVSGLIETAMKRHISDRTDWRLMLKGNPEPQNLVRLGERLLTSAAGPIAELRQRYGERSVVLLHQASIAIDYPVVTWPVKVSSFNFDKTPEVSGTLQGIKGQYLIFDSGVINIRKFGGYRVEVELPT